MTQSIFNHFWSSRKIVLLNGVLIAFAIAGNLYFQAFCRPTTWASILIAICFINSVFFPILIKHEKYLPIVSLVNGISFCLFLYCILFLEHLNFLSLIGLFIGIGFLTYIPHFFAVQILWRGYIKLKSKVGKRYFLLGVTASIVFAIISGILFKQGISDIEDFKSSNYQNLNTTYMTEKILGMEIIYHTAVCEFDGWRPPKHDPILNLGLWLNGSNSLLDINLEERKALYEKFFPNRKVKFACSCAFSYQDDYHNDHLWKQNSS